MRGASHNAMALLSESIMRYHRSRRARVDQRVAEDVSGVTIVDAYIARSAQLSDCHYHRYSFVGGLITTEWPVGLGLETIPDRRRLVSKGVVHPLCARL
jgi:hypothetical protein